MAEVTGTSLTDLEALQAIWASSDGLQDASDNAITVSINGLHAEQGSDETELEAEGYPNPLDASSYARLWSVRRVSGAFLKHAEVEENTTTGRADLKSSAGWVPKKEAPRTGTAVIRLDDIFTTVVASGGFAIELQEPAGGWQDYRARALAKWLDDHRVTGDSILDVTDYDDIDSTSDIDYSGREFQFDQDVGSATANVKFTITQVLVANNSLLGIYCSPTSDTPATFDVAKMTAYFRQTTVDYPTANEIEEGPLGNPDEKQPVYLSRGVFSTGELIDIKGRPTWQNKRGKYTLGGGYGHILTSDALTVETGDDFSRLDWADGELSYNLRALHFVGTGAQHNNFRLDGVDQMVPNQGEAIEFEVKNDEPVGTGRPKTIRDDDGNSLFKLYDGERATVRANWDPSDAREIEIFDLPDRTLRLSGGGNDTDNVFIAAPLFHDNSASTTYLWVLPFDWDGEGDEIGAMFHDDAFDLPDDDALSVVVAQALDTHSGWDFERAIKTKLAGTLSIDIQFTVELMTGATGNMPRSRIRIYRQRGTAQPTAMATFPQHDAYSGVGTTGDYSAHHTTIVQKDDIFFVGIRVNNPSLSRTYALLQNYAINLTLKPTVELIT